MKPSGIKIWILIATCVLIPGAAALYFSHSGTYGHPREALPPSASNYLLSIENYSTYQSLQGAPLADKHSAVQSVKLIYDIGRARLLFINSNKFRYHYDFCTKVLGDDVSIEVYNAMNYGTDMQRRYILASLNYYAQSRTYTAEVSSEDRVSAKMLHTLMAHIKEHTSMGDSVQLLVNSDHLLELKNSGRLQCATILPSELHGAQTYQPLNTGTASGLLLTADMLTDTTDTRSCIVLMKGTPVHVPICAGIVTDAMQTPLSHINVLCHNRNIPSAASTHIYSNAATMSYIGRRVRLTVTNDSLSIVPDTVTHTTTVKPREKLTLVYNITVRELIPVRKLSVRSSTSVGNKAAGMGELAKVAGKWTTKFSVPEGAFAIPFFYYHQHLQQPTIQAALSRLHQLEKQHAGIQAINEQLKTVRSAIKSQQVSPALLQSVNQQIAANGTWTAYRFRSSSNAEDAAGFSGAGLYTSKTGIAGSRDKPVDAAIKKVWASAWSEDAYHERRAYNIDDATMMMGILVHRSFPDEAVNGVAITRNIYRNNFPGFTINMQLGDVPVVSPPDSVTCEQVILMRGRDVDPTNFNVVADYLCTSNLNSNKPLLTKKQYAMLYAALESVQGHYYYQVSGGPHPGDALDIEFKFDRNGKLYLKQVRPYR